MYTYSHFGRKLSDFEVYGMDIFLPLRYQLNCHSLLIILRNSVSKKMNVFSGLVTLVARNNSDNEPDFESAINMNEFESGTEADLTEKPHNAVEVTPGGPFLLRVLHQQEVNT